MKLTRSAIAAIVLLVVTLLAVPTTAAAQSRAVARSAIPITTATWGAAAVPAGGPVRVGMPHTVESSGLSALSATFDIVNTGTSSLTGQAISIESRSGLFVPRNPPLTLVACPAGTWNSKDVCPGGEVTLGTNSGNFTSDVLLEPGRRYSVRITSAWYLGSLSTKITVNVSREDHVRAATVTSN